MSGAIQFNEIENNLIDITSYVDSRGNGGGLGAMLVEDVARRLEEMSLDIRNRLKIRSSKGDLRLSFDCRELSKEEIKNHIILIVLKIFNQVLADVELGPGNPPPVLPFKNIPLPPLFAEDIRANNRRQ